MSTDLSFYPRPKDDTGCGFHDSADKYAGPGNIPYHAETLKRYGITWYKLLCDETNKVDRAKVYKEHGIEPVVRLYSQGPHPKYRPRKETLQAYKDAGVMYVEWGNEPNIGDIEWFDWPGMKKAPIQVAHQAYDCFNIIKGMGMIPAFPALTPGGYINHRQFYIECVGEIVRQGWQDMFEGSFIAVHPRPLNHPPCLMPEVGSPDVLGHPPMDTGLWEILWIHDFFVDAIGWCPPMIATEAGYSVGDSQDSNWPRIDTKLHYLYNYAMFKLYDGINWANEVKDWGISVDYSKTPDKWPDWFLASCYWLEKNGTWGKDALFPKWIVDRETQSDTSLFAGWILAEGINWVRDPSPVYEDILLYDIMGARRDMDWLNSTWGIEIARGDGYHVAEIREHEGPATQIVVVYDADGNGVPGVQVTRCWPDGTVEVEGYTDERGRVGFGLGRGDYITGPGQGVSSIRVGGGDTVSKLGMVAGTEHRTLTLVYRKERESVYALTKFIDTVRNAAWTAGGIAYNPDAAFPKFARDRGLGNPETPEFNFTFNGVQYRGQGFSQGIIYAEIGKWDDIKVVNW